MNQVLESVPTTWSAADEQFFLVVRGLHSAEFTLGASVLLASYDDEVMPLAVAPTTAPAPPAPRSPRHVGA